VIGIINYSVNLEEDQLADGLLIGITSHSVNTLEDHLADGLLDPVLVIEIN